MNLCSSIKLALVFTILIYPTQYLSATPEFEEPVDVGLSGTVSVKDEENLVSSIFAGSAGKMFSVPIMKLNGPHTLPDLALSDLAERMRDYAEWLRRFENREEMRMRMEIYSLWQVNLRWSLDLSHQNWSEIDNNLFWCSIYARSNTRHGISINARMLNNELYKAHLERLTIRCSSSLRLANTNILDPVEAERIKRVINLIRDQNLFE